VKVLCVVITKSEKKTKIIYFGKLSMKISVLAKSLAKNFIYVYGKTGQIKDMVALQEIQKLPTTQ
jgi:hypothetical protein